MRIAVLDIGGSCIKSGLWDGTRLWATKEVPTIAEEGGSAVLARAAALLRGYEYFDAIGISTAGQVNLEDGSIESANRNLPGYTKMSVRRIFEEAYCVPVSVENDVNAAALGEMNFGAAKNLNTFLCLTYGTGVGGAIVMNRKIWHGAHWAGGYFGGIVVHPDKRRKNMPLSGCYERYASVTALVNMMRQVDPRLDDGRKIFAAFERPEVRSVVDAWIDEIVLGLVTLTHIFDPEAIVIGGGILAQSYIPNEIRKRIPDRLESECRGVRILSAALGNSAGMMGAAAAASAVCEK